MTFNATTVIKSLCGDVIRFKRKNSYIDISASVFKQLAVLNGSIAVFMIQFQSDKVILKWNTRKKLTVAKGVYYNGILCLPQDTVYFESDRVSSVRVTDDIVICTKTVMTPALQDSIVALIRTNMGVSVFKLTDSDNSSNSVSFRCRLSDNKAEFESSLRNMLNLQLRHCNLYVRTINSQQMGIDLIYKITFEVGD